MSKSTEAPDIGVRQAAIVARNRAYAPYSNFLVGAAVLDENNRIHSGVNVENAAYPEGLCAEASAIAAMVLAGGRHIKTIAIAGSGTELCTPCGGCRQKIREFASPDTRIIVLGPHGAAHEFTLDDLLPASFGPDNLSPP